jgi:hypothetical protein
MEEQTVGDIDSRDFDTKDFGSEELDEMIVYGGGSAITPERDESIPLDDVPTTNADVSHAPLNLGGTGAGITEQGPTRPVQRRPAESIVSSDRITSVKTFFAKLHAGAIDFLDQQINTWLRENPGISIKRTNSTVGDVQAKKTEPNLIITVWY